MIKRAKMINTGIKNSERQALKALSRLILVSLMSLIAFTGPHGPLVSFAFAQGQAGTDIAILKSESGELSVPHAKENQIAGGNHKYQSDNKQIWICFCHLFTPHIEKIGCDFNDTAHYHGEKIGIGRIPLNHDCTPLTNDNEITKNIAAMSNANTKLERKSKTLWWRRISGEMIPIESQATATLPKMFEALLNCPTESLMGEILA
jgi:hypothetical protein